MTKVKEIADGDEDFIKSVVEVFLEEVPSDLEALEAAVTKNDFEYIYKLSHRIKPNLDLFGMEQTRVIALEIETLAKNSQDIESKFSHLKKNILQVVSALRKDFL